jgi:hypothetical protein
MIDPTRLYTALLNTGLQQKDNPLYQVIHDLIGQIVQQAKISNSSSSSSGGGLGPQGPQGLSGLSSSIIYDGFNTEEQWIIPASSDRLILQMLTVDSPTLFVDSVNHWVGIGTLNPTAPLTIQSDLITAFAAKIFGRGGGGSFPNKGYISFFQSNGITREGGIHGDTGLIALFGPSNVDIITITDTLVTLAQPSLLMGTVSITAGAGAVGLKLLGRGSDDRSYMEFFKFDGVTIEGAIHGLIDGIALTGPAEVDVLKVTDTLITCAQPIAGLLTITGPDGTGLKLLPTGTEAGQELYFFTNSASTNRRNWLIGTYNVATSGEFAIKQSNAAGGNPFSAGTVRLYFNDAGSIGVGITTVTARLHLPAGTASASSAPLKFTSGTLLTSPEAGAIEFLTDKFYGTQTTGPTRKAFAFVEDIFPKVVASTFEKAETGSDANILTYTVGAADEFLVLHIAIDVSALTGTSIAVIATWKDSNNNTKTSGVTLVGVADDTVDVPFNAKTATNVVVSAVFIGSSTTYNISAFITRLK